VTNDSAVDADLKKFHQWQKQQRTKNGFV